MTGPPEVRGALVVVNAEFGLFTCPFAIVHAGPVRPEFLRSSDAPFHRCPDRRADALADEFEDNDPSEDDRGEPVLIALRRAANRRALIEKELIDTIRRARRTAPSSAAGRPRLPRARLKA